MFIKLYKVFREVKIIRMKLMLGLVLVLLLTMTCIEAHEVNDTADNSSMVLKEPIVPDVPDKPDLVVNETIYVTSKNMDDYFKDNVLTDRYDNKIFVFEGNFEDKDKLVIDASNVTIKGDGAVLKNTVFDICSDNVSLANLKLDLDSDMSDNDGAAIIFSGNNLNLDNLDINYVASLNCEAYAIYGVGNSPIPSRNLKITNSRINFEGYNIQTNTYNCAIKVMNYLNFSMENNTIVTSLPLKDVNHGSQGATLDSDFVLSVGVEYCDNFIFRNNTIISDVNYRTDGKYPTLDAFMISKSDNALILDNSIYMSDFITYPGLDNYLYGIDIYNLNNLTLAGNKISIVTTGGRLAAGTAYPIQITGPISNVNITSNDLYSFSNGPNIGIYSQNYYGSTELSITNNKINVTGLAGAHEWALVAGIESQDTNSVISNNIIEVHSVSPVNVGDNIYGVSYRQSTDGDHKYSIQNNTVFSDGFKSVYLLSSNNSVVSNNLLISYNDAAKNGDDGFGYGDLTNHQNINFENNPVIRAFDYFAGLNNNVDNGEEYSYTTPINSNGISNKIDASSVNPNSKDSEAKYNPLIPGSTTYPGTYNEVEYNPSKTGEDNSNSKSGNGDSLKDKKGNDAGNVNATSHDGASNGVILNNTDSNPSDVGSDALSGESKSGGGESSSARKKAFELEDLTKNIPFIPSVIYVVITLILIIVGYKRKKSNFT